MMSLFRIS